jgi:hypothetical protein
MKLASLVTAALLGSSLLAAGSAKADPALSVTLGLEHAVRAHAGERSLAASFTADAERVHEELVEAVHARLRRNTRPEIQLAARSTAAECSVSVGRCASPPPSPPARRPRGWQRGPE